MSSKSLVGIIDYGMGNIKSVQKALSHIGVESFIVEDKVSMQNASHLILPGVGSFGEAVKNLKEKDLFEAIKEWKKPLLGICLGFQLFAVSSEESPGVAGLGFLPLHVKKLEKQHVGWDDGYYFVHGYAYYEGKIVRGYKNGNLWGTQWHPEKSSYKGLKFLEEFSCLPSE